MFSTDRFSYKNRVFTAEASDFPEHKFRQMFTQVFDDACDQGFELTSARTGKKVKVTLSKVYRDREGELTHWEFIPYRNLSIGFCSRILTTWSPSLRIGGINAYPYMRDSARVPTNRNV